MLPVAVFLVAAMVSFATGTSWGTMAILTPLAVPLVLEAAPQGPHVLAATVASILGGAVFGDHCSPIGMRPRRSRSDPAPLRSLCGRGGSRSRLSTRGSDGCPGLDSPGYRGCRDRILYTNGRTPGGRRRVGARKRGVRTLTKHRFSYLGWYTPSRVLLAAAGGHEQQIKEREPREDDHQKVCVS
jgi:hypothetical protein